jgi:two-component system CheB/CheR fusion protein
MAAMSAQLAPNPSFGARRILVVDDNGDCREMLTRFLEMQGHEVRTAVDGADALVVASEFCPEIIFLDLCMPGMDGVEACARLRERAETRHAVIFALTALAPDQRPARQAAAAFDAHLLKPMDLDRIGALVSAMPPIIAEPAAIRVSGPRERPAGAAAQV